MSLCGGAAEIVGVFDGHGTHGHTAAEMCCEVLPKLLLHGLARTGSFPGNLDPTAGYGWKEAAAASFEEMHGFVEMLTSHAVAAEKDGANGQDGTHLDARASGSTATMVVMMPRQRALVTHV